MAEVKWIKIVTDIFDDDKILLIESLPDSDAIIVIWFKLLCLAGKQNNGGVFMINGRIPYTDEMFATIMRRPVNTVRLALRTFEEYGMVEVINDAYTIPNWEKHQNFQKLELAREATRKRVASHREKQRKLAGEPCNTPVTRYTPVTGDVTVTPCNADREDKIRLDKSREEEIREEVDVVTPRVSAREDDHDDDSLMAYISSNLYNLTPGNWEQLREIMEDGMSAEMVKLAVDAANAQNARTVAYVMSVLNKWLTAGYRTPDDVKAAEAKRQTKRGADAQPTLPPRRAEEHSYD